jgi:hypothetical protein
MLIVIKMVKLLTQRSQLVVKKLMIAIVAVLRETKVAL